MCYKFVTEYIEDGNIRVTFKAAKYKSTVAGSFVWIVMDKKWLLAINMLKIHSFISLLSFFFSLLKQEVLCVFNFHALVPKQSLIKFFVTIIIY